MRKHGRGFIVPFTLAAIMAAVITVVLFHECKGLTGKIVIVETGNEQNMKETEAHKNYALTDPAEKLEVQGSEISYTSETHKSNQLEDMIRFIAENLEKVDK